MVTILETKVMDENYDNIKKNSFGDWEYINNNDLNPKGRILVAWN